MVELLFWVGVMVWLLMFAIEPLKLHGHLLSPLSWEFFFEEYFAFGLGTNKSFHTQGEFTEFTEGHQYRRTDGFVGTGIRHYNTTAETKTQTVQLVVEV